MNIQKIKMGGDGGSIPTRGELVKLKTTSTTTKNENSLQKWRFCALSDEILRHPVVLDPRGRMMMKEVLVQFLLDGRGEEVGFGFKDVVELKLTGGDQFICPVTKKMLGSDAEVDHQIPFHILAEQWIKDNKNMSYHYVLDKRAYILQEPHYTSWFNFHLEKSILRWVSKEGNKFAHKLYV